MDASFEERDIKVDQKAETFAGHPEIRKNLCFVNRVHLDHSFQFADHQIFNQHVESEPFVKCKAVILDRNRNLTTNRRASLSKLVAEARFVNGLQQSRPQTFMHLEG